METYGRSELMDRLGSGWLVEDDGWYANVTWARERFPVGGVHVAQIFLRPWRDPHEGERLPGEPIRLCLPPKRRRRDPGDDDHGRAADCD